MLKPKLIVNNLKEINFNELYKKGYRTLICDLDNTLVPFYQQEIDEDTKHFINSIIQIGFMFILVSNNTSKRVNLFLKDLNIKYYSNAKKPLPFIYKKIIKENNLIPNQIITLGDQLLTDCLGANLLKLYSIYVSPICNKDAIWTKFNRFLEKIIFKLFIKK